MVTGDVNQATLTGPFVAVTYYQPPGEDRPPVVNVYGTTKGTRANARSIADLLRRRVRDDIPAGGQFSVYVRQVCRPEDVPG